MDKQPNEQSKANTASFSFLVETYMCAYAEFLTPL